MRARAVYMVHVGPSGSVFVKEHDFFRDQGGFEQDWGKAWVPIVSTSIEAARREGCNLPGATPYERQAVRVDP